MVFNIRQGSRKVLKTEAGGRGFQHLPRDPANVNPLKNLVRSLLLHKIWKQLLYCGLFLALFCYRLFTDVSRTQFPRTMLVLGPGSTHLVTAHLIFWKARSVQCLDFSRSISCPLKRGLFTLKASSQSGMRVKFPHFNWLEQSLIE